MGILNLNWKIYISGLTKVPNILSKHFLYVHSHIITCQILDLLSNCIWKRTNRWSLWKRGHQNTILDPKCAQNFDIACQIMCSHIHTIYVSDENMVAEIRSSRQNITVSWWAVKQSLFRSCCTYESTPYCWPDCLWRIDILDFSFCAIIVLLKYLIGISR